MPASFVEISLPRGLPAFLCPVSGMTVWNDEGFNEQGQHSPFIRFFLDWAGETWIVSPSDLSGAEATQQNSIVALLQVASEESSAETQDETMKRIARSLPSSAVVFEVLNIMNPRGHGGGEICYVCFDFATANDPSAKPIQLVSLEDLACE